MSATRSGNSFQNGPSADFRPPSIATIPSNKLQSSRSWQKAAARTRKTARQPVAPCPAATKLAPANAAAAMLAIEM